VGEELLIDDNLDKVMTITKRRHDSHCFTQMRYESLDYELQDARGYSREWNLSKLLDNIAWRHGANLISSWNPVCFVGIDQITGDGYLDRAVELAGPDSELLERRGSRCNKSSKPGQAGNRGSRVWTRLLNRRRAGNGWFLTNDEAALDAGICS